MSDSYWTVFGEHARALPTNLVTHLKRFGEIPGEADQIADANFPGSARDASAKNAFRHALGTGMIAQQLGGGVLGAAAAKGAGYLWEGMGAMDPKKMAKDWRSGDIKHDLNANALGARAAMETQSQAELIELLKRMGQQSVNREPPGIFERSPGYMTRSVR